MRFCDDSTAQSSLHDILVGVVQEIRHAVAFCGGKNDIQTDIEWLPGVAHRDGVAVQAVQLLDALEAIIDEERPGSQSVVGIDAFLDTTSLVVILEGQAVCPLVRLDHAVLAVPELRPAGVPVHRAVGYRAVQVVGKAYLHIVFCGGRVLVEAVRGVGPGHARLAGGDPVADGVVGVEVRVGRVNIGLCPRQLASVIVGIGDGVGIGVCAAGAGHGGATTDCVVGIAVY